MQFCLKSYAWFQNRKSVLHADLIWNHKTVFQTKIARHEVNYHFILFEIAESGPYHRSNSRFVQKRKQKDFTSHLYLKQKWCDIEQKWCDLKPKWRDLEHEWSESEQMWFRAKKWFIVHHTAESQSDCRHQLWFQNWYDRGGKGAEISSGSGGDK